MSIAMRPTLHYYYHTCTYPRAIASPPSLLSRHVRPGRQLPSPCGIAQLVDRSFFLESREGRRRVGAQVSTSPTIVMAVVQKLDFELLRHIRGHVHHHHHGATVVVRLAVFPSIPAANIELRLTGRSSAVFNFCIFLKL